jgi:hypothetical protein
MDRYIVTIYYMTPSMRHGSYRWENFASNHDEAIARARNTLYNNGRYKVGKELSGNAYLMQDMQENSLTTA